MNYLSLIHEKIIYLLIAVFAFGIIASGFTNQANADTRILIQSTDNNISPVTLSQSAKIISARLKNFSPEKFELTVIPEKNQIQVILPGVRLPKMLMFVCMRFV